MKEAETLTRVAALALERLEQLLRSEAPLDPQKCKHITGALKDIQQLQSEDSGPRELVVTFDADAGEMGQ